MPDVPWRGMMPQGWQGRVMRFREILRPSAVSRPLRCRRLRGRRTFLGGLRVTQTRKVGRAQRVPTSSGAARHAGAFWKSVSQTAIRELWRPNAKSDRQKVARGIGVKDAHAGFKIPHVLGDNIG